MLVTGFIGSAAVASAQVVAGTKSVAEISIDSKGGETRKLFQAFDQKGNILEELEYEDDGKLKDHVKYEYDDRHRKIKETHLDADGKVEEISTYEYDDRGNRVSKTETDANGKVKSKKKYVYEYY